MNSFNQINGSFAAENGDLLLGLLKEEVRTFNYLSYATRRTDVLNEFSSSTSTGEPVLRNISHLELNN